MSTCNVLVFSEQSNCVFTEHTLQILTKASEVAKQLCVEVDYICYGNKLDSNSFSMVGEYGADNLYAYLFDRNYRDYRYFVDVLSTHIEEHKPQVVLIPANDNGKLIAAILSIRFNAGLTADCIDIRLSEQGEVVFSRAALNDSVIADISGVNSDMVMGTIKKDAFKKEKRLLDKTLEVLKQHYFFNRFYTSFNILEQKPLKVEKEIDLELYDIVFCLGRGVKNVDVVRRFEKLSLKLKVGLAATRTLVEKNYISKAYQVGQSGKSIRPKVYVGFGVSGASQHIVGIKSTDIIVSVNTDNSANILNYADYVINNDLHLLLEEMESRVSKNRKRQYE